MKKPCIICDIPVEVRDNIDRALHRDCAGVAEICCTSADDGIKRILRAPLEDLNKALAYELLHGARKTLTKALQSTIKSRLTHVHDWQPVTKLGNGWQDVCVTCGDHRIVRTGKTRSEEAK
jgi:hypothetical protein